MWKEFKEFAVKGNALDLAIGVIIGAAFGKIVSSVVDDIIMPPLGLLLGKVGFTNLFISLNGQTYETLKAAKEAGAPVIAYGSFLNNVVSFVIVAFVIFVMVKQINRMNKGEEEKPVARECPFCKREVAIEATRCPHCTSEL